jgi:hypothetical protein
MTQRQAAGEAGGACHPAADGAESERAVACSGTTACTAVRWLRACSG